MKADIHPAYNETTVHCACGNQFTTRSTAKNGVIHAEVCNQCHPFFTGRQKLIDTEGRVDRFTKRFGAQSAASIREAAKANKAAKAAKVSRKSASASA